MQKSAAALVKFAKIIILYILKKKKLIAFLSLLNKQELAGSNLSAHTINY